MPTTIAQFITDVANAKNTGSGKVEWNGNSLQSIMVNDIAPLFLNRGLAQVADTTALQALSGSESKAAGIDGVGLFFWAASGTPNGSTIFSAAGNVGVWKKQNVVQTPSLATLSDVQLTSPSNGQFLSYQNGKWVNSTASLSLSNLSDVNAAEIVGGCVLYRSPIDNKFWATDNFTITEPNIYQTNLALTGNFNITGNLVVSGNVTLTGALTLQNSLAVNGTLSAVGNFAIATNKFTVAAASGNTVVAGTLTVAGVLTLNSPLVSTADINTDSSASISGDLYVGNECNFDSNIYVSGDAILSNALSLAGNLAINTNKFTVASATGNTVVAGTLSVASDLTINTNKFTVAAVSGNTTIAGTLGVAGNFAVATNRFTVAANTGNTVVAGTLTVQNASLVVAAPSTSDQLAMTNSSIVLPASAFTSFGTISTGLNSPVALKWDSTVTTTGLTLKTTEYFPIYVNGNLKKVALTN